jgi:hypothetical protein
MEVLASTSGFFEVGWRTRPALVLPRRPAGPLGPRYRVVYLVPGPSGQDDRIRQDLYPFARGGPLTYTVGGQRFFDTQSTLSGWFRAKPRLTRTLLAAGLPKPKQTAPVAESSGDDNSWLPWTAGFLVVAALAVGALALVRRHPRPLSA